MNSQGRGGDRPHEATTILVREAYRAAGDPNRYPEQIAQGLRAWKPKKLYFSAGFGVIPSGGRGRPPGPGRAEGTAAPAGSAADGARGARGKTGPYDELPRR